MSSHRAITPLRPTREPANPTMTIPHLSKPTVLLRVRRTSHTNKENVAPSWNGSGPRAPLPLHFVKRAALRARTAEALKNRVVAMPALAAPRPVHAHGIDLALLHARAVDMLAAAAPLPLAAPRPSLSIDVVLLHVEAVRRLERKP
jgi:hypothetical protein